MEGRSSGPSRYDPASLRQRMMKHYGDTPELDTLVGRMRYARELADRKGAIIAAHYYQLPEIQAIADITGDSLALALAARDPRYQDASFIVSSTVHFMAEKIRMLSGKRTIIPDPAASCSIAEGMNGAMVRRIRARFPRGAIVGYINTTAETKAELDAVCTSANAEQVMRNIPGEEVIMVPDHYFARNIAQAIVPERRYLAYRETKRAASGHYAEMILYDVHHPEELVRIPLNTNELPSRDTGTCIVHEAFTPIDVELNAPTVDIILAHPEVHPDVRAAVLAHGGMIGGTQKMIEFLDGRPDIKTVITHTECALAEPLYQAHPDKIFQKPCQLCPYMKKNKLETVITALETEQVEVNVPPEIEARALRSLERMFELTGKTGPLPSD